jgi:hypothetical protein
MDVSLAGWLGAMAGAVIGVINSAVVVAYVERRLRALDRSESTAERADFERRTSLMRRMILAIEVTAFAAIGYWLGRTVGG